MICVHLMPLSLPKRLWSGDQLRGKGTGEMAFMGRKEEV